MPRLENDHMEMYLQLLRVDEAISRSLESVRGTAEANGVRLCAEPSGAWVVGNTDRLVQVLANLLSNAVNFSPRGASVRVAALERGDVVDLRVSDRGCGIPVDCHDAMFEPFRQVVEQLGGSSGVDSEAGRGSTFWVRLEAAATPPSDPLLLSLEEPTGVEPPDVFVAEDEALRGAETAAGAAQ